VNRDLFQLVAPEEYGSELLDTRRDSATLIRTVGSMYISPFIQLGSPQPNNFVDVLWKAALFTANEKEIDDAFANDPTQFDIQSSTVFAEFCSRWSPIQFSWFREFHYGATGALLSAGDVWMPPYANNYWDWDVGVARKLSGDGSLWLLINSAFLQSVPQDFGGSIDVESRTLIHD